VGDAAEWDFIVRRCGERAETGGGFSERAEKNAGRFAAVATTSFTERLT